MIKSAHRPKLLQVRTTPLKLEREKRLDEIEVLFRGGHVQSYYQVHVELDYAYIKFNKNKGIAWVTNCCDFKCH